MTHITRIKNDVNGNPRFVVHFLSLLTREELDSTFLTFADQKYAIALARAATIGGRKYHNKSYGGGIVFQSYGGTLDKEISALVSNWGNTDSGLGFATHCIAAVFENTFSHWSNAINSLIDANASRTPYAHKILFDDVYETCKAIKKAEKIKGYKDAAYFAAVACCLALEESVVGGSTKYGI